MRKHRSDFGNGMIDRSRFRTVSALGIIQIFAWGSSYYLMAVLAKPMAADTGISPEFLAVGVSLGFLVGGLAASFIGRMIQIWGGRPVVASGMFLIAMGLALLARAQGQVTYLSAWIIMGLGMSAGLYDAAFSTLGRLYGHQARSAITHLTLWGGFASTVCWPLTAWLVEIAGWRGACLAYAGLHLFVTLPLALLAIPREARGVGSAKFETTRAAVSVPVTDIRFVCIVIAGVILASLSTVWSIHLVTMLTDLGYSTAAAIGIGTLIGPSQVGARVIEMLGKGRHHPVWTMVAATALVFLGFLGLILGLPAAAAMIAYGAGNGVWSIARGALPLALFGPNDYPRIMGRLAAPMLIASAAAPTAGAWLVETFGAAATLWAMACAAMVPILAAAFLVMKVALPGFRSKSDVV